MSLVCCVYCFFNLKLFNGNLSVPLWQVQDEPGATQFAHALQRIAAAAAGAPLSEAQVAAAATLADLLAARVLRVRCYHHIFPQVHGGNFEL